MAINAHQTVVGIFDEGGMADKAVNDLERAGFTSDQLYYAGPGQSPETNYWQGIKRFFVHSDTSSTEHDLDQELKDLNLSDEEIDSYKRQFELGRTIVAIKAPGREDEALSIMRTNGGHS
jgi:hypothetical protein